MAVTNDKLPDLSKYTTFLNDMKREFEAKYKFRIGGKDDAIFRNMASVINDPSKLALIKSQRTKTVERVNLLSAAGSGMSGVQRTEAAVTRLGFVKSALSALKSVSNTAKPAVLASTVNVMINEISDAVNQYFTGRYNGADSSGDAAFAQAVRDLLTPYNGLVNSVKNRLAGERVTFNKANYDSMTMLKKITDRIQSMPVALPGGSGGGTIV